MSRAVKRALWVMDYFPRPHDHTTGVWALETIRALQEQGVEVKVFSPTPWIPGWLAWTPTLRDWSRVPPEWRLGDVEIFFQRSPHYPHRFVTRGLYHHLPWLDSWLVWWTCRGAIERVLQRFPAQAVHANFVYPGGFLAWRIKRRFGLPVVVHEHSHQRLEAAERHAWRRRIYHRVISEADAVITPNRRLVDHMQSIAPEQRVHAIPCGMPASPPPSPAARPAKYARAKVVLSVGALNEGKGHACLLRAMEQVRREVPDVKCLIVGQGVRRAALAALIRELGLEDCVELCGQWAHEDVMAAMSWCDVFALPSQPESFGTVYVEAMTYGKPVIACEGEGLSDVVQDGVHALLVTPRDVDSLVEALRRLLLDPSFAAAMGARGRVLAEQELSRRRMAERIISVYEQVLNERPVLAAGGARRAAARAGPARPHAPGSRR